MIVRLSLAGIGHVVGVRANGIAMTETGMIMAERMIDITMTTADGDAAENDIATTTTIIAQGGSTTSVRDMVATNDTSDHVHAISDCGNCNAVLNLIASVCMIKSFMSKLLCTKFTKACFLYIHEQ